MSAQWHSLAGTTTQRSHLDGIATATMLHTVAQQLALLTTGSGGLLHPLEDRWDIQTATLPAATYLRDSHMLLSRQVAAQLLSLLKCMAADTLCKL